MDGRFGGARDLARVAGGTDNERSEIHGRLRIREKDGGWGGVLQLRLVCVGDDANDFDWFLNGPADAELLAENTLPRVEAFHESVVDDGDGLGVETVAVFEVAAAQEGSTHGLEVARGDDEELRGG